MNCFVVKFKNRHGCDISNKYLAEIYANGPKFDIDLISSDQKAIPAHKCVVSMFSIFLKDYILDLKSSGKSYILLSKIQSLVLKKVVDLFYNGQITIGTELKPQIINALIFLKVKDVEILERLSNVSQNKVPMVHVLPAPMMTKQMMPPLPILTNNVQYNRTNNDHQVSIRYIDHPCCDMFVNPMNIVSVHPIPHKNVPHLLRLTKVIGNGSANGRISSTYQGSVANHMTATKSMQQPHNQFEKKNMYNAQGANNGVGSMVSKVVENNGVDLDGDFYMEVDSR